MNNGVCPIHILYRGQILEENLFAAFVRALFSFSKDMSEGEKSISSMRLGDSDIHYLAQQDEKYFVAISTQIGISQNEIDLYLNYISFLFSLYYPEYIEKIPPFEPESFELFKQSIDFFVRYSESKIDSLAKGEKDFNLGLEINSVKTFSDKIVIQSNSDSILRIINKNELTVFGTFYPEDGEVKFFDIQKNGENLCIITDKNELTIVPLKTENNDKFVEKIPIEISASWLTIHPIKNEVFFGSSSIIYQYEIDSKKMNKYEISSIIQSAIADLNNHLLIKDEKNSIQILSTEHFDLINEPQGFTEKIHSLERGPENIILIKCLNRSVYLWRNEEKFFQLNEKYPFSTRVSYDNINQILFLITEFNEFLIYDSNDGTLLVNYNIVENAEGVLVTENNKIIIIYSNGNIKWFLGTIDKQEIANLRNFLTKRVENVENNIIRIHSGFLKIIGNLENNFRTSLVLKNDLNQVKVFKQQLKRLIDTKLLERTSIIRDLYFQLLAYEKQVKNLINLIAKLEIEVEMSFKKSKENELSGKTPKERIEEFLEYMKPRDQIGLGTLADNLQLPYEECLNHLKTLEARGLLPGFLTRGSALSIKDNVIFVKKDPKFEETGITSF